MSPFGQKTRNLINLVNNYSQQISPSREKNRSDDETPNVVQTFRIALIFKLKFQLNKNLCWQKRFYEPILKTLTLQIYRGNGVMNSALACCTGSAGLIPAVDKGNVQN